MCLIIRCDPTKTLSEDLLADMQTRNRDGWGMMWIDPDQNKILTKKSSSGQLQDLITQYNAVKDFPDLFIHLRMKTHGLIDHTNTHPYPCGHGIWLMHNGIISIDDRDDTTKSDTWHFINKILKPILDLCPNPHHAIRSKKMRYIIERFIGSNNRIVLGDRGGFVIFNEPTWHTITNEHTGVPGLLVSNTYAWDAYQFGKPKRTDLYDHAHWKPNPPVTNLYPTQPSYHKSSFRGEFEHIVDDIYMDAKGSAWRKYKNGGYTRAYHLDDRLDEMIADAHAIRLTQQGYAKDQAAKTTPALLSSPAKEDPSDPKDDGQCDIVSSTTVVLADDTILTETDEPTASSAVPDIQNLVLNWGISSADDVDVLVYSDPDTASLMLHHLLQQHHAQTSPVQTLQ